MRKVLAIDGGGIRGIIPARFLADIESKLNVRVQEYFDLIVGTSTGGIIALALGLGFQAQQVVKFYEEWGPVIFPKSKIIRLFRSARQLVRAKHNIKALENAVRRTFGERKLGHSQSRLVIPSFDVNTGTLQIWKTAHHPKYKFDYERSAAEVAISTAAAPLYFQTYRSPSGEFLLDGGIWANCPVLVAAIEAVYILRWEPSEVKILSLGCSQSPLSIGKNKSKPTGAWQWKSKIADLFLYAQKVSSLGAAKLICPNITRIDPEAGDGVSPLDDSKRIPDMNAIGSKWARQELDNLSEVFFSAPVEPFVPYYRVS